MGRTNATIHTPLHGGRPWRRLARAVLPTALLAAALLLAGCAKQAPESSQEDTAPGGRPDASAAESQDGSRLSDALREGDVPAGVYFLHDEDESVGACVFVGERETGGGALPGRPDAEQARARAVLDMAEQTRWMGGNVVVLPNFRADFHAGKLQGRVYRCGDAQRREIYRRAAAEENLTVVAP